LLKTARLKPICKLRKQRRTPGDFDGIAGTVLQRFSDARGFSIARLLKLKLELSTLDARR
jgi:hypothetical protein